MKKGVAYSLLNVFLSLSACQWPDVKIDQAQIIPLSEDERLIGILATNDIHGGVEPQTQTIDAVKYSVGGLALLTGMAQSTRKGVKNHYGAKGGVLLLDAGDQFQGTLLSNFDEGDLVFKSMELAGYDAVVPGNHDYDFGPIGWLDDKVSDSTRDKDPRGVIKKLMKSVKFPLLSANTYIRDSLLDLDSKPIEVKQAGCTPVNKNKTINWAQAQIPDFLKPYVIKSIAGVNVALIGLDHPQTGTMTTPENVSDYCFRDMVDAYLATVAAIGNQAEVFVLITHFGNVGADKNANLIIENILKKAPGKIHAVIAGHTHEVNNENIMGVPLIQSGSGGEKFGRIALIWDTKLKKMNTDKMKVYAGIKLIDNLCDQGTDFCKASDNKIFVAYDGYKLKPNDRVDALIKKSRLLLDRMAKQKIGEADGKLKRHRIDENSMSNAISDVIREVTHADIVIVNAGGIRADFGPGVITYEDLFKVIPFGNHGVMAYPMESSKIVTLMKRSIMTCGAFGALMQSGLKIRFKRDCTEYANSIDPKSELLEIQTVGGELIFQRYPEEQTSTKIFKVATLDFLMAGGSGFDGFKDVPVVLDLGIIREVMAQYLFKQPAIFSSSIDGRYYNESTINK